MVVTPLPMSMDGRTIAPPKPAAASSSPLTVKGSMAEIAEKAAAAVAARDPTAAQEKNRADQAPELSLTQALAVRQAIPEQAIFTPSRSAQGQRGQPAEVGTLAVLMIRELQRQGESDRALLKEKIGMDQQNIDKLFASLSEDRQASARQHKELTDAICAAQELQAKTTQQLVEITKNAQDAARASLTSAKERQDEEHRRTLELLKAFSTTPSGNKSS